MLWSSAGHRGAVRLLRCCWSLTVNTRILATPKCPLRTLRFFSISAHLRCPDEEVKQPAKHWSLEVNPFCTVRAKLSCSISVRPLDLHAFPEADRAFITVDGADGEQEIGPDDLHVHYDEQRKELLISAENVDSMMSIDLAAPIKSSESRWRKYPWKWWHPATVLDVCSGDQKCHQDEVFSKGSCRPLVFVRSLHHNSRKGQRTREENGVWRLQGADREGQLFAALCQGRWGPDNKLPMA